MHFPLYALRAYRNVYMEGEYKIIETNRGRWVLDRKYKTDHNYWQRRVALINDPFRPYPMYPLKKKFESLAQILHNKSKGFIDSSGKLHTYKKTKFYKLRCCKIDVRWCTSTGRTAIRARGIPRTFIIQDNKYTHFTYVKLGRLFILYDLHWQEVAESRIKI